MLFRSGTQLLGANLFSAKLGGANLFGAVFSPEGNPGVPSGAPSASLTSADWTKANTTSWRGTKGELLKKWLQSRFPVSSDTDGVPGFHDAPVAANPSPVAPASIAPANESPAAAARAGRATGGRSVRALFGGVSAPAHVSPKDSEIGDDNAEMVDVNTVRLDTVQVRASGRPGYHDTFATRDMAQVSDLMGGDSSGVTEDTVQVRTSANPADLRINPRVSSGDLLAVQDLMKEK